MNVAVLGQGYVGLITAVALARLGHTVIGHDIDQVKLSLLERGQPPLFEPGLPEVLEEVIREGRYRVTRSLDEAVQFAEVIFFCVGTPADKAGAVDLSAIEETAEAVGQSLKNLGDQRIRILVNKSTVPVGTCELVHERVARFAKNFIVVSNPEFLQEGTALMNFLHPHLVVIGLPEGHGLAEPARQSLERLYRGIQTPILWTTPRTAELIKYFINSHLALQISYTSLFARLCEATGADITVVTGAAKRDPRIGPQAFLNAGLGFGGSCLPKDVQGLACFATAHGVPIRSLLDPVMITNREQLERAEKQILEQLGDQLSLRGRILGFWGIAFKVGTDDVRNSPGLKLAEWLVGRGLTIRYYDPRAVVTAPLCRAGQLTRVRRPEEVAEGAAGIVLTTALPEVLGLDFGQLKSRMVEPFLIFDGRNALPAAELTAHGFRYHGIGR